MIFTHLPEKQEWTLLDIDVAEEQFRALPFELPQQTPNGKDYLFEKLTRS
jgi:hypothetical protein